MIVTEWSDPRLDTAIESRTILKGMELIKAPYDSY
jgi:hypothetical protein